MKKLKLFSLFLLSLIICLALSACAVSLTEITLNTDNVQKEFTVGDKFSYDGLIVTASYSKGEPKVVTDYSVSAPDMNSPGAKTVTVTYRELTADYYIIVAEPEPQPDPDHVLVSISLDTENVTKTFTVGDTFTYDGLVVTGHFQTAPLTQVITSGYRVSTPDMTSDGDKTVTVIYLGKEATYTINVVKPAPRVLLSIEVSVNSVKRSFTQGDKFTYDGLVVTAYYNQTPFTEIVTDYVVNEDEIDTSVAGQQTVVISYQGKTASYEIVVREPVLVVERIEVNADGAKTKYVIGDRFSANNIVVTAYYDNGTSAVVTDYEVNSDEVNMDVANTYTVYVTYGGATASYEITVSEPTLTSLVVNADGAKTKYYVGEEFSYEGIVVTARYSNKTSKEITEGYEVSDPDMNRIGKQDVTVTYMEVSTTYEIEIVLRPVFTGITVDASGATTVFTKGSVFNYDGIVVTAHYDNGADETITEGYTVSDPDMNKVGKQDVIVTYNEETATYEIEIKDATLTHITVNTDGAKTEYYVGDEFSYQGIVVTAHYSDGSFSEVTLYDVDDPDMSVEGVKTITVTYLDKKATYEITVEQRPTDVFAEEYKGETIILEAELATLDGKLNVQSDGNTSNGQYVGGIARNDTLTFVFKSTVAQTVELYLSMGYKGDIAKAFAVYVNGGDAYSLGITNTGGWKTMAEFSICKVELVEGLNTVVIQATSADVNVDYLKVAPASGDTGGGQGGEGEGGEEGGGDENLPTYNGTELTFALADAVLAGNCKLHPSGFIQVYGGGSVTFSFKADVDGPISLCLYLASKATNAFDIYVNGAKVDTFNDTTTSNGTYANFYFNISTLKIGQTNTIEIRASEDNGASNNFNIQVVTITPAE